MFNRPVVKDCVAHATWALVEPPPTKRGIDPVSKFDDPGFRTTPVDHVGGVAVMTLSENVVLISTVPVMPVSAADEKFDQLMSTRPVSGSTPMNSLSAASLALTPL